MANKEDLIKFCRYFKGEAENPWKDCIEELLWEWEKKMVEYKVTGKNKIECAKDYVENHIGEEIHFLNNDTHCSGWLNHKSKCTNENIWKSDEEMFSLYYTINEIANAMYRLSHTK